MAGEAGPSIQGLLPESIRTVCLKQIGLVPRRRSSAWGSNAIHHGGSGAGARSQPSWSLAHRE